MHAKTVVIRDQDLSELWPLPDYLDIAVLVEGELDYVVELF